MKNFIELYKITQLPVLQNVVYENKHDGLNCPKGDLSLVQDLGTGLIYNQLFDESLLEYDSNYQNEQSLSTAFQSHLIEVSQLISNHFHDKKIVEIGCGKGYFWNYYNQRVFGSLVLIRHTKGKTQI